MAGIAAWAAREGLAVGRMATGRGSWPGCMTRPWSSIETGSPGSGPRRWRPRRRSSEVDDDLVGEVTEIPARLCARRSGRRPGAAGVLVRPGPHPGAVAGYPGASGADAAPPPTGRSGPLRPISTPTGRGVPHEAGFVGSPGPVSRQSRPRSPGSAPAGAGRRRPSADRKTGEVWWPRISKGSPRSLLRGVPSKEAIADGIRDAVKASWRWQRSRAGEVIGRRVGLPRLERKGRDPDRCPFSTGAIRVEPDRRAERVSWGGGQRQARRARQALMSFACSR